MLRGRGLCERRRPEIHHGIRNVARKEEHILALKVTSKGGAKHDGGGIHGTADSTADTMGTNDACGVRGRARKSISQHEDNMSAISLIKNPKAHSRTKHIDVRHHFIREAVENRQIQVIHCPTEEMHADIFTKALTTETFEKHRGALGLLPKLASSPASKETRPRESVENQLETSGEREGLGGSREQNGRIEAQYGSREQIGRNEPHLETPPATQKADFVWLLT